MLRYKSFSFFWHIQTEVLPENNPSKTYHFINITLLIQSIYASPKSFEFQTVTQEWVMVKSYSTRCLDEQFTWHTWPNGKLAAWTEKHMNTSKIWSPAFIRLFKQQVRLQVNTWQKTIGLSPNSSPNFQFLRPADILRFEKKKKERNYYNPLYMSQILIREPSVFNSLVSLIIN